MLREVIASRVGDLYLQAIDPGTDIGEVATTVQVELADEGVVLSLDEVEAVIRSVRDKTASREELIDALLAMVEE